MAATSSGVVTIRSMNSQANRASGLHIFNSGTSEELSNSTLMLSKGVAMTMTTGATTSSSTTTAGMAAAAAAAAVTTTGCTVTGRTATTTSTTVTGVKVVKQTLSPPRQWLSDLWALLDTVFAAAAAASAL